MSTPIRRLEVGPEESLPGHLITLAHRLGQPPIAVLDRLTFSVSGLIPWTSLASPTQSQTAEFAEVVGVTPEVVTSMTISGMGSPTWAEGLPPLHRGGKELSRYAQAWILPGHTKFCPECLQEGHDLPVWRSFWQTPWAFACTRHRALLHGACPHCGVPIGRRVADQRWSMWPNYPTLAMHPAACRSGMGRRQPCGFDLTSAPSQPVDPNGSVMAAQLRIESVIRDSSALVTSAEVPVSAEQWLRDIRSVATLALLARAPRLSVDLPVLVSARYAEHARRGRTSQGETQTSERVLSQPPADPILVAAALAEAVDIVAQDYSTMSQQIDNLSHAAAADSSMWANNRAILKPSDRLHSAMSPKVFGRMSLASLVSATDLVALDPRHVPARLPLHLVRLLPELGVSARDLRRGTAVLMHQYAANCSVSEAAVALGYSYGASVACLIRMGRAMDREQSHMSMYQGFGAVAAALSREAVDYQRRRRAFTATWRIPDGDWSLMIDDLVAQRAWHRSGATEHRRDLASLWVWSIVTSGDSTQSPMFTEKPGRRATTHGLKGQLTAWQRTTNAETHAAIVDYAAQVASEIDGSVVCQ